MRPILILTAGFGEGHNAAARNLKNAISAIRPDHPVEMADVFEEAYGGANRLSQRLYLMAINHTPWLWTQVFHLLDTTPVIEKGIGIFQRALRSLVSRIDRLSPLVIVTTYPGYNHLLDSVYGRDAARPFKLATVVTDSITINSVWYRCSSDWFLVANDETAAVLREAAVPPQKIVVTGFPVPGVFSTLASAKSAPLPGEAWRVLYMVNSGKIAAEETARRLLAMSGVRLSVTFGRDEALGIRLSQIGKEADKPIELHGWTPEMPRLMAENHVLITKAGGATVQESLAARTPMIINQVVPGQEEGNARLVVENGAGTLAETPGAIANALEQAFEKNLWPNWYAAASRLSRPNAASDAARFLFTIAAE